MHQDFREIRPCGGRVSFIYRNGPNGSRQYSVRIEHRGATAAAWMGIYALPEGIPVGMIEASGIGAPWNPPPHPDCLPVFISSDSEGRYGHQCGTCGGYWRSEGASTKWPLTCSYCGERGSGHEFLTSGQRAYVEVYCHTLLNGIQSISDETVSIDMDAVAEKISRGVERPAFYHAEESQQHKFTCDECRSWNDVLGKFAYCSSCGTRNDLNCISASIDNIRDRANSGDALDRCVRDLVSEFDTVARQYTEQLVRRVPMIQKRRNRIAGKLFHDIKARAEDIEIIFGIKVFDDLSDADKKFVVMMFQRRHVYDHNGGQVDQKYIDESGDTSVRLMQALRETRENVHRLANLISKMTRNFHMGFHQIFMPEPSAIEYGKTRRRVPGD